MAEKKPADNKTPTASNGKKPSKPKTSKKPQREFPIIPLEEALKVPQAIRQKNNGHPWDSGLVAKACGGSKMGRTFFYLAGASRDYGLTSGSRDTAQIELTELGRAIVFAPSPQAEQEKKVEAFFNVEKFKQVYDHYNGSNLPEEQYVSNTLENKFEIPQLYHKEFIEVFKKNCAYLGIENGLGAVKAAAGDGDTRALDIRVMGQPHKQFDKVAFVMMPFSEKGTMQTLTGLLRRGSQEPNYPGWQQSWFRYCDGEA